MRRSLIEHPLPQSLPVSLTRPCHHPLDPVVVNPSRRRAALRSCRRITFPFGEVERTIKAKAKEDDRRARYEASTKTELATSLANRLFAGTYKHDPDALRAVAARLARLEKTEIFALDEFVASEQDIQAWVNTFRGIAAALS